VLSHMVENIAYDFLINLQQLNLNNIQLRIDHNRLLPIANHTINKLAALCQSHVQNLENNVRPSTFLFNKKEKIKPALCNRHLELVEKSYETSEDFAFLVEFL